MKTHTLSLNDVPALSVWKNFVAEISAKMELLQAEHIQNQRSLELGFEEMQKVWSLIHQREKLISSILNSSEDMIITLNDKLEIIEFNYVAEKIFDRKKSEIQGSSIFNIVSDGTLLDELRIIQSDTQEQALTAQLGLRHEGTVAKHSGEKIPLSISINRVLSEDFIFYHLYLRDLSQLKKAEAEIEQSRAQVIFSSKLSALGEMAGGVAHEINTPLAIIQMRSDQLLEGAREKTLDDAFLIKSLESIDLTIKRIAKVVKSLRFFSGNSSQEQKTLTRMSQIVDDTFNLCMEKFNNNDVRLTYHEQAPFSIHCRPIEISQVLLNLLNNSFDAIEKIPDKWIMIETKSAPGERIQIEVTDSGIGIPPEIQDKMMNPFFTTKEIGKGTGLGLSISKGILESHGGRIFVDSSCPNTRFVLEFPNDEMDTAPT